MILYIDGSNILSGGGKTHLIELLRHASPQAHGFSKVILFGHQQVLNEVIAVPWLIKRTSFLFRYSYVGRIAWHLFFQPRATDGIWFVPGTGMAPGRFVTMCQNLLPLERVERNRYFGSFTWLRLVLLSWIHCKAFRRATGTIFLNHYCFNVLPARDKEIIVRKAFIPHGVSSNFSPRLLSTKNERKLRLICVSSVDEYKHQWLIAEAVHNLILVGHSICVDFIGPANPVSLRRLKPYLSDSIQYRGAVLYSELPDRYSHSDAFIFGSTCETFGMVLLEAMACGLPILCSNRSSMPETLGDNAIYFDPLKLDSIMNAIDLFYHDSSLREALGKRGIIYAKQFTWRRTSDCTFKFIRDCSLS